MGSQYTIHHIRKIIENYLGNIKLTEDDLDLPMLNFEMDSLGRLELLLKIERELGVTLDGNDIWNRKMTIRDFITKVMNSSRTE